MPSYIHMLSNDILIGLAVGFVQGYLFRPLYIGCYKYSVYLIARFSSSYALVVIIGNLLTGLGVSCFVLSVLLFKSEVVIWKIFVSGWFIGFFIGAFVYAITHRNQDRRSRPYD